MLYSIYCIDRPGAQALRASKRDDHLDYVADALTDSSLGVFLAGPLYDDDGETVKGSLFVVEAEDLEQVRSFSAKDPYREAGVFEQVDIHPFRKLLPKR